MSENTELTIMEQKPEQVIIRGKDAAKELTKIVSSRDKKLVMAGKQYLFFEDWQTIGKFYGVTAKVTNTQEIRENDKLVGFVASAVAITGGVEVSGADGECTYDEQNWQSKPRFQLRSMAQTRACAKALRNCLGWVAVLAGYEPTPAEEMAGIQPENEPKSTDAQRRKIFASAKEKGYEDSVLLATMIRKFNTGNTKELTKSQASEFIQMIESGAMPSQGEKTEEELEPEDIPY